MYLLKCNFLVAIMYGYLDRTVVSQGPSSENIMGEAKASVVTYKTSYMIIVRELLLIIS